MSRSEALPSPADIAIKLDKHRANGDGFTACCPAHDDANPSLSLNPGENGGTLWFCHAGCSQEAVQDALHARGIWPYPSGGNRSLARPATTPAPAVAAAPHPIRREHVDTYLYTDEAGVPISRVRRGLDHFEDGSTRKTFAQWLYAKGVPDPSPLPSGYRRDRDWVTGPGVLEGMRRVLFNLPGIVANPSGTVFVVEGEKDARTLAGLGLLATTKPEGVVKTADGRDADRWRPVFTDTLRGRQVVILPDNDEPGHRHAGIVASWLHGVCPNLRIVILPGLLPGGDVTDWVMAGGTLEELERIVKATPLYVPVAQGIVASSPASAPLRLYGRQEVVSRRLNLTNLADVKPSKTRWVWPMWLALGKVTTVIGDPGLGKSGLCLDIAARLTTGRPMPDGSHGDLDTPGPVLVMADEDDRDETIVPRLLAMGADMKLVDYVNHVTVVLGDGSEREDDFTVPECFGELRESLVDKGIRLAIIDPIVAFMGNRSDAHKEQDVRAIMRQLTKIGKEAGCAIILIRHMRKSGAGGGSTTHAGGGSIAFVAAARTEWLVKEDPDDASGQRRIVSVNKTNLAAKATSLAFVQVDVPELSTYRIQWHGQSTQTAASLLSGPQSAEERSALTDAVAFLRDCLAMGEVNARDVFTQARNAGISEASTRRAKIVLGVQSTRIGDGLKGSWQWRLPVQYPPQDAQGAQDAHGFHAPMGDENLHILGLGEHLGENLDMDDVPFREAPVAQGAQSAQAFHAYTGHETLSTLGVDEHLGNPPGVVPVAPQPALAVTFTGTGGSGCDIEECYSQAIGSFKGQILCSRHFPKDAPAPSLPMNLQGNRS
jgi:putative DNA primase/helicase